MGVGRNLAYKKEEFFNVNGFIDHMKIRSGDDDLFINQAAKGKNTTICFSPDSFTYSMPGIQDHDPTLQRVLVKRTAPGVLQIRVGATKEGTAAFGRDDLEVHVDERGLVKKVVGSATVSERLFTWGELPMGRGRVTGGTASRGAK